MKAFLLGTVLTISAAALAQEAPPTVPPEFLRPNPSAVCVAQKTQEVMEEMGTAVGSWKEVGVPAFDSPEGQQAYQTNEAILVAIQNPQSTVNKLIRTACALKSRLK